MFRAGLLAVVTLLGCKSNDRSSPAPSSPPAGSGSAAVAAPAGPTMRSTKPVTIGALRDVRLVPTGYVGDGDKQPTFEDGNFEIQLETDFAFLRIQTLCRVHDRNLLFPFGGDLKQIDRHRASSLWRPVPVGGVPSSCEIRFFSADEAHGTETARGVACYKADAITAGECPPNSFPPPKLPDGMTIGFELASTFDVSDGAVAMRATFTVGDEKVITERPKARIRCEAEGKIVAGEDSMVFVELPHFRTGGAAEAPLALFTDHTAATPPRCELTFETRVDSAKKVKPTVRGTYCITGNTAAAGACTPALKAR